MKYTTVVNPKWADDAHTTIIADVTFEKHGTLSFGASASDVEAHGREIYARALAGDFGPIAAYVAPPVVVPTVVTMRQARAALILAGLIDSVDAAVAQMTGTDGQLARNEWEYSPTLKRDHPLVSSLSAALGLTPTQLDGLFTTAAGL